MRFFNFSENPDEKFDWNNHNAEEKLDGSLILLFNYNNKWLVNTRGSFAQGELNFTKKSWADWVWETLPNKNVINQLIANLPMLWNSFLLIIKLLGIIPAPQLYLLSAIEKLTGNELEYEQSDKIATDLGVLRPKRFKFNNAIEIKSFLIENAKIDPTFEGFVLVDQHKNRLKIKSETYVSLHHLVDNGNIYNPSRLVPLVLNGERSEVVSYFPEVAPYYDKVEQKLTAELNNLIKLYGSPRISKIKRNSL